TISFPFITSRLRAFARDSWFLIFTSLREVLASVEHRRGGDFLGEDARDLAVLLDLGALAAAGGGAVFHGADGLLRAAVGLHVQQVAVAGAGLEAQQLVILVELDELHALARTREVVHLI